MYWYWKVRIYNPQGHYAHAWVRTERNSLREIDTIKDFYENLTGCKMLLEGMSETQPTPPFSNIYTAFYHIFKSTNEPKAAS